MWPATQPSCPARPATRLMASSWLNGSFSFCLQCLWSEASLWVQAINSSHHPPVTYPSELPVPPTPSNSAHLCTRPRSGPSTRCGPRPCPSLTSWTWTTAANLCGPPATTSAPADAKDDAWKPVSIRTEVGADLGFFHCLHPLPCAPPGERKQLVMFPRDIYRSHGIEASCEVRQMTGMWPIYIAPCSWGTPDDLWSR